MRRESRFLLLKEKHIFSARTHGKGGGGGRAQHNKGGKRKGRNAQPHCGFSQGKEKGTKSGRSFGAQKQKRDEQSRGMSEKRKKGESLRLRSHYPTGNEKKKRKSGAGGFPHHDVSREGRKHHKKRRRTSSDRLRAAPEGKEKGGRDEGTPSSPPG